jgi:predicted RNase H-like HicB family nuclease
MFTSYVDAFDNCDEKRDEYFTIRFSANSLAKERARASGRYIASLQALKRAALREGRSTDDIEDELKEALEYHSEELKQLDLGNRKSKKY